MTSPKSYLAIAFCLSAAGIAVLTPPSAAKSSEILPWDERVLTEPLDFEDLARTVPQDPKPLIDSGERLFVGKFTVKDGAGRPEATQAMIPTKRRRPAPHMFQRLAGLDANSCASCHNVPVIGGAGDFTANAFVSEGFESADFDTTDPQFSNERGTTALQGSGLIELLAREMTSDMHEQRTNALKEAKTSKSSVTVALETKGVSFGALTAHPDGTVDVTQLDGIDYDLVIRPFSQKGVIGSIRQFTVNALNHHHGIQATERFGAEWTGTPDFDGDGVLDEISPGQVSALVAWQATLPAPTLKADLPEKWATAARRGEDLFSQIGCAHCHRPALPLENLVFQDPSPFENAGTLRPSDVKTPIRIDLSKMDWVKALPKNDQGHTLVPLYGDLKRHKIADASRDRLGNELLSQRFVARDVFLTAELWGVGSTAPYGHRGDITSLHEIIDAHGGGATQARKAYSALEEGDRQSIIAFLRSLEIVE